VTWRNPVAATQLEERFPADSSRYPGYVQRWLMKTWLNWLSHRIMMMMIIIIIIIITNAKIIVILSRQKRCRGTLQSSKCDADAPKYGARTFALLVSIQRAKVTQSFSGKEPSSAPCKKTQVYTSLEWCVKWWCDQSRAKMCSCTADRLQSSSVSSHPPYPSPFPLRAAPPSLSLRPPAAIRSIGC